MRISASRVNSTRRMLRLHTLQTIFNEFDAELMELSLEARLAKYAKMAESPFRFYRGSAYLFYFDVSYTPFAYHTPPDYPTWIQGDLHLENFGAFQNEKGAIVYDVNDFDEGYLGSYLHDLLRMSVSIALAARQLEYSRIDQGDAIRMYLRSYYRQMHRFAEQTDDPVELVFTEDNTKGPIRKMLRKLKLRGENIWLDEVTDGEYSARRFDRNDELVPPTDEELQTLQEVWPQYLTSLDPQARREDGHYAVKDIAVKHGSGTASIGLDRYYILIEGQLHEQDGDGVQADIVLEAKEVRTPVPAYFMQRAESFAEAFPHQGQRVITTQKAMHHEADPYLGWFSIGDREFYVRERSPFKKRVKTAKLADMDELLTTLKTMGRITAKIHARADADIELHLLDYHSEDAIVRAMGPNPDAFCDDIAGWALSYADQVEEDYELFVSYVQSLGGSLAL